MRGGQFLLEVRRGFGGEKSSPRTPISYKGKKDHWPGNGAKITGIHLGTGKKKDTSNK